MQIYHSPYQFKTKVKLNTHDATSIRSGTLLKVQINEHWGVADLAPWPSLGDLTWEQELTTQGVLFQRAKQLALEDLNARKDNIALTRDKALLNNFIVNDYQSFDFNKPELSGETVKIKGDRNIEALAARLNSIACNLKLRIDFNSCLSKAQFVFFLTQLTTQARKKVEYVEDPTGFTTDWSSWNKALPIACDFEKVKHPEAQTVCSVIIVKPSRESLPDQGFVSSQFSQNKKLVFTSAIEHPVGLAHALCIGQIHAQTISGFNVLDMYEDNPFLKYFSQTGNQMNFSDYGLQQTGIGMSDELALLKWINL